MKTIIFIIVALVIGFFYGGCHAERALEGCGHAANTVNHMLSTCEWDFAQCQISLIEEKSNNKKIIEALLPDHSEQGE